MRTSKAKISWLINTITTFYKDNPQGLISKKKLIASFVLSNSSTERKAKELIKILNDANMIIVKGDEIRMGIRGCSNEEKEHKEG